MQRRRTETFWVAAVSVAVGTAVAVVGYAYLLRSGPWPPAVKATMVGLIFASSAAVAAGTIVAVVRRCLSRLTTREAIVGISLGLFCGWGLVIVVPIMPPPGLMPEHWLQVIATGEKNSLSEGPAVCVVGLMDRRTRRLVANAYGFHQDGNWQALSAEHLFTCTAATLTWNGRVTSAVALKMYASRTAGKVRVVWDGVEHFLDLYAPADPAIPKVVLLELSGTPDYWTPRRTCVCLCAALSMAFPLTVICLWLLAARPRGGRRFRRCRPDKLRSSGRNHHKRTRMPELRKLVPAYTGLQTSACTSTLCRRPVIPEARPHPCCGSATACRYCSRGPATWRSFHRP